MSRLPRQRVGIDTSVRDGLPRPERHHPSDSTRLVNGALTGFAWREEVLARVDKLVPYNAEAEMKKRGARYETAVLPFVPYTVVDGNLVTGPNPASAEKTAKEVAARL